MSVIKDQARIDEMRRRLYERGVSNQNGVRNDAHSNNVGVEILPEVEKEENNLRSEFVSARPVYRPQTEEDSDFQSKDFDKKPDKKSFFTLRTIIVLGTIGVFFIALLASSLYLMFGNNQISNKNITINLNAPLTIGGGEVMPITISITNQNKVPIQSAVLIVSYPAGTKSTDAEPKDLFEERINVDNVNAGETINIPVKAVMFGEENQEKQLKATIEYRLVNSNGTFYKDSDPLTFKINSSPIVISVDALNKVSAGQDITVKLTIKSNAPTALKDMLITANYPNNFNFSAATPNPSYRESAWLVKELQPGKSTDIIIKGTVVGQQAEKFQMQFSAGTPKKDNEFTIGSVLTTATSDFVIEQPFIGVNISVNNQTGETVTLPTGVETQVVVRVQNTLEESLYDTSLEVSVKGNILVRDSVTVSKGIYDSVKDVIRFDPSGDSSLKELAPGATKEFIFSLKPSEQKETPTFVLTANTYSRRVFENKATEQLVGTAKTEVKFTSSVKIDRTVTRNAVGIVDTGPIPPTADTETTYSVTLTANAGGNNVSGAILTTSLPQYVNWKNIKVGDGTIEFNPVSKELNWTIGNIDAGQTKTTTFQIGLLPSQNQIGTTPAVLGTQRFRATDKFTNEVVRAESVPASSELPLSTGMEQENGKVQAKTN